MRLRVLLSCTAAAGLVAMTSPAAPQTQLPAIVVPAPKVAKPKRAPVRTARIPARAPARAKPRRAPTPAPVPPTTVAQARTAGTLPGIDPNVPGTSTITSQELATVPAATLGDALFTRPGVTGTTF